MMQRTRYVWIWLCCCMLAHSMTNAISIVYSLKIGEVTKELLSHDKKNHTLVSLIFDLYQKKYIGVRQNYVGAFASYIYSFDPYYFRTDMGASHIHETAPLLGTTFSGAETDDILFTMGRNVLINNKARVTVSGLFGIPTHEFDYLRHVTFGFGQVGVGAQFDGSYSFTQEHFFLYGARYVYFFARNATDLFDQNYKFSFGNIGDLLVAYKHERRKHGVEIGYTMRSQFGATMYPKVDLVIQQTNYLESTFYGVYSHTWTMGNTDNRFLANISYGFDPKPKVYGSKCVVVVWGSWVISF